MFAKKPSSVLHVVLVLGFLLVPPTVLLSEAPEIEFDHIHTFAEVADYLDKVVAEYPNITKLHTIGKSFLGKDLLVLEITNKATGEGLEKPGYFIDGNLHAGEVVGGEICLNTIRTLVEGYSTDPLITELLDTRVFYIMPKLNPDGSDHYITKPDGMRSVVRPFDDDGDGLLDEDPPEDLDGDGNSTLMRVRDPEGPLRTSPEDPRLMIPVHQGDDPEAWQGEWKVYPEGIDNDNDGRFNEDGVGGIDINRNFPEQWQPSPISYNPGPYPLSEAESRAVADFLLTLPNLTGLINYHMAGHVAVYPPSNLRTDPITGDVIHQPYEDEQIYRRLGRKAVELIDNALVQVFKIHGASPATWHGSIWGIYVDWAYYRLGIFAWIHEVGTYPGVTEKFPSFGTEIERLRWSDENLDGKLFVDWRPFDHPELGKVEIGGFLNKIYEPKYRSYINVMCLPGPDYERLLANHTKWHLYLISQSPLVRITDIGVTPLEDDYFRVEAEIKNLGFLPTHVTQQALIGETAKTVKASISVDGGTVVGGDASIDLGHLPANSGRSDSSSRKVEWVVAVKSKASTATVEVVSQKGGTDRKKVDLKR